MNGSSVEGKEPHGDRGRGALVDPLQPFAYPKSGHSSSEAKRTVEKLSARFADMHPFWFRIEGVEDSLQNCVDSRPIGLADDGQLLPAPRQAIV